MSSFDLSDSPASSGRGLRRLEHASVVPVAYRNRESNDEVESVESSRAQAVRDGYVDGFADGQARAEVEARRVREVDARRFETALAALGQAVERAQEEDQLRRGELQTTASQLVFALLEELLSREIALAVNPGREAITRALSLDKGREPATVHLNPEDLATLGDVNDIVVGRELNVVADASVEPGGALIEIGRVVLDGQLRTALERVRKVLLPSTQPLANVSGL
ncbi:MAG TPA: FliH/SctL family protein [Acidimicrobiales bacterium]|jgi:flagellar assembly protein FliH|nr:FliH/SctL family protein [Acidimicrobiales bacterium]